MTPKIGAWMLAVACVFPSLVVANAAEPTEAIQQKAEAGDADAQLALGIAAEDNETKPDYVMAARWYKRAAEGGSGKADWQLGMLYETGEGVEQSYEQARLCYERAVQRGIDAANMRLGLFYLEGWGVDRDRAKAVEFVTRAADAGYIPAMKMLSGMYAAGIGTKKDPQQAIAWAERAAKLDDAEGQLILGSLSAKHAGLKRDVRLAREWYQLSAEQEYSAAMLAMASTFLKTGASLADREQGKRWLELALENQSSEAGFILAVLEFTSPQGATKEAETRARAFLEKAVSLGCLEASEVFELEKSGIPLRAALRRVATVPMEVRYVERANLTVNAYTGSSRPPKCVKVVKPVYPASLKLAGQEGMVMIRFVVDTKGLIQEPEIVSSPHPAFADSALRAIKQFRFEPGVKDGRIVSTRMQIPIYFQLKVPLTHPPAPAVSKNSENPAAGG